MKHNRIFISRKENKVLLEGYLRKIIAPKAGQRIRIKDLLKKTEKYKNPTKMNEYDETIYTV